MIFKEFLGKTVDAAKQSAQQMYGSDLPPLRLLAIDTDGKEQESQKQQRSVQKNHQGVIFERTANDESISGNAANSKLKAIRQYAAQQMPAEGEQHRQADKPQTQANDTIPANNTGTYYSRANIRSDGPVNHTEKGESSTADKATSPNKEFTLPDQPQMERTASAGSETTTHPLLNVKNKTGVEALHGRLDELESFLHSALTASDSDYAAHPAFQNLLHTGIHKDIIADWFSLIIDKGINPYDQTKLFMSKLTAIIHRAVDKATSGKIKKHLLFMGLSGSGKTRLIMKLTQHPDFMFDRSVGVVSIIPEDQGPNLYYTILESFCKDQDIPYCKAENKEDVLLIREAWSDLDHVLFDTPSLPKYKEAAAGRYRKLLSMLVPIAEKLETHCLVDASRNQFHKKDSTALYSRLNPDFLAITHLDETSQWGPLIPLLKEVACPLRYISTGNEIPGSLNNFDPKWFTKTMLQNA